MKMPPEIVLGRASSPVQAERSSAVVGGYKAFVAMWQRPKLAIILALLAFALFAFLPLLSAQPAYAQEQAPQSSAQPAAEPKGIGGELVKEEREATGADEEEHADLKHSSMVRLLARK